MVVLEGLRKPLLSPTHTNVRVMTTSTILVMAPTSQLSNLTGNHKKAMTASRAGNWSAPISSIWWPHEFAGAESRMTYPRFRLLLEGDWKSQVNAALDAR